MKPILLALAFALPVWAESPESWWSVQPVPAVSPGAPDEVDRLIAAALKEKGLTMNPEASRQTLIRRLSFDLHGLPPTPEAVEAFVKDPDPRAYAKLVDRMLASPHYGERWARHWLDIAHYADTHGFERDQLRNEAWRYRDWVIQALNADLPYDEFLRRQIAGDVLKPEDPDAVVATGFLAAGPWDFVGQVENKNPELRRAARALDLDDMVTQVMTASVAMTVNCARCHDHKLDPISQKEYYQLVSVFAGLKRGERPVSETAVKEYEAEVRRLDSDLRQVTEAIGRLQGTPVDLAEIVGPGIDPRSGKAQVAKLGDLGEFRRGTFSEVADPRIDSVFIPAQGGETQISSTDLRFGGWARHSGKAWDAIRNGPVASQHSTKFGEIDYHTAGHSLIGLHANAGITFDLAALRESAQFGEMTFSCVVGYGGEPATASAEFWILVDGVLKAGRRISRPDAVPVNFTIPADAKFLTLISTDGGNGYGHDQVSFGDPRLHSTQPRDSSAESRAKLQSLQTHRAELETARKGLAAPAKFYGVIPEAPPVVQVLDRGNPETPGETVTPGTLHWAKLPAALGGGEMGEGARRVALADWITHPDNPLTARVIVNRLWHWHFGQGLVATPSDFGLGGEKPSHPALLDWLAGKMRAEKWSLKAMHRVLLNSAAYKQTSAWNEAAAKVDAQNRLLWRANPSRLEAEALRDAVLMASGKLNPAMGGPGYRDFKYTEAYAPIYDYITADAPELWRRSVYRFVVRTTPHDFLTALDCPDPANFTPKRNVTTTAIQSLALYNNEFMLKQAGYFEERLRREAGDEAEEQVRRAFELAFGRAPEAAELAISEEAIETHGLDQFCRGILNANEFVYVD